MAQIVRPKEARMERQMDGDYWLTRWETVRDSLEEILFYADEEAAAWDEELLEEEVHELQQSDIANELLWQLLRFGDTLFRFFYKGYYGTVVTDAPTFDDPALRKALAKLALTDDFFDRKTHPPAYVFNSLFKQVSIDFLRIQRAAQMRLGGGAATFILDNLLMADVLAERALNQGGHNSSLGFQFKDTRILTYPNDQIEIRILPYANALFIGFPISAFALLYESPLVLSPDYLALAHEAGHLVYRFGVIPKKHLEPGTAAINTVIQNNLRQQLAVRLAKLGKSQYDWLFAWLEELFADVYGCFIEGPLYGAAFQSLMFADPPVDIHQHDSHHPVPVLRPYIHRQIMRSMTQHPHSQWPAWAITAADSLTAEWQQTVVNMWPGWVQSKWPNADNSQIDLTATSYDVDKRTLKATTILDGTQIAVDLIVDKLFGWGATCSSHDWRGLFKGETAVTTLSDAFDVGTALTEQYQETAEKLLIAKFEKLNAAETESAASAQTNQIRQALQNQLTQVNYSRQLVELLLHGSWSDEGPKGNINPDSIDEPGT